MRGAPEALSAHLDAFRRQPSLERLRAVLHAARRAGRAPAVRAHLMEVLEADAAADPRLLYRLYLEDGQDTRAADAARALRSPGALLDVADATRVRFRILSIHLYLEAADLLAGQGNRRAYARAAAALCWVRALMEGEEVRWSAWMRAYLHRHRRRRALMQELVRAGLDVGEPAEGWAPHA
jgi:hypothetical protein